MSTDPKPEPFMDPAINEQFKQIVTAHAVSQDLEAPDLDAPVNVKNKAVKKAEPEPEPETPAEPEPEPAAKKTAAKKTAAKG